MNIDVFEKMMAQDALWIQTDPILPPKRRAKGAQDEPKTDPKDSQNEFKIKALAIEKWTAQGSMTRFDGGHVWPRVTTGG